MARRRLTSHSKLPDLTVSPTTRASRVLPTVGAQGVAGLLGLAPQDPPRTFAAFCDLVAGSRARMPRRLKQAAAFLVAHPDQVAFSPVARIAKDAAISGSAFVRLAQRAGYRGFSDLQSVFRQRLLARDDGVEPLGEGGTLDRCAEAMERSLRRLTEQDHSSMIERTVQLLMPAHTIFLVGQHQAALAVLVIGRSLTRANIRNVPLCGVPGFSGEELAFATAGDAAIMVVTSPPDTATIRLASRLEAMRIPTVLFADSRLHNPFDAATTCFEIAEEESIGLCGSPVLTCLATTIAVEVRTRRMRELALAPVPGELVREG